MTDHRAANRRLWDAWSDDFQALWTADTAEDERPPAPSPFADDAPGGPQRDLLDAVEGRAYVELGCGGGQGTVGTAALGADPAVGVDLSGEQLAHARALRDQYGVDAEFVRGDVTDLPLPADRFDVASSEAVYQMVADLTGALRETRRVLRDGGVLVVSVPHPLRAALDEETGRLERSYFDTGRREITIDEAYDAEMVVFDRTVGDVHAAFREAGFDVRRVIEHRHPAVESGAWDRTDRPDVLWRMPWSVRLWAVA